MTPFHLAVKQGGIEVAQFLVNYVQQIQNENSKKRRRGRRVPFSSSPSPNSHVTKTMLVESLNIVEQAPIHIASLQGDAEMVQWLLEMGSSFLKADLHGWQPRQLAELHGFFQVEAILARAEFGDIQVFRLFLPMSFICD